MIKLFPGKLALFQNKHNKCYSSSQYLQCKTAYNVTFNPNLSGIQKMEKNMTCNNIN